MLRVHGLLREETLGRQRMLRAGCLTLVLLTLLLTVATAHAAEKPPSLSITSPKGDRTVTANEVEVKLSAKNAPKGARYRYVLDGAVVTTSTKTSIKVTGITDGPHTAGAEMLTSVGQSLTPPVTAQVSFSFKNLPSRASPARTRSRLRSLSSPMRGWKNSAAASNSRPEETPRSESPCAARRRPPLTRESSCCWKSEEVTRNSIASSPKSG